jgi:uncharacterized protein DUF2441
MIDDAASAGATPVSPRPTYFHCAPIGLAPGAVIQPGNWGRIIRLYETADGQIAPNAIRESLLEFARQLYAPQKPSRLQCVFALPNLASAISFRNQHQRLSLIYEVVALADDPVTHIGDYELVIRPYRGRYFQTMLDLARDYWTTPSPNNPEVLLPCPVQIIAVPQVPPP